MVSLAQGSIDRLIGEYYKPRDFLTEDERLCSSEHYARIKGSVLVFGREARSLVQISLIYPVSDFCGIKYWDSTKQNVSFDTLGSYEKVEDGELPWNNGDDWYSNSSWAQLSMQDVLAIIR